jgi:hypothetical protein
MDLICERFLSDLRQVTKAKHIVIKLTFSHTTKVDLKQRTRTWCWEPNPSQQRQDKPFRQRLSTTIAIGKSMTYLPLYSIERGRILSKEEPSPSNKRSGEWSHALKALSKIQSSSGVLGCTENWDVGVSSNFKCSETAAFLRDRQWLERLWRANECTDNECTADESAILLEFSWGPEEYCTWQHC